MTVRLIMWEVGQIFHRDKFHAATLWALQGWLGLPPHLGPVSRVVCDRATLAVAQPLVVFAVSPPDQVVVEPLEEVEQPGAVEAPVIVDPPARCC
jgi:hypothetical protein